MNLKKNWIDLFEYLNLNNVKKQFSQITLTIILNSIFNIDPMIKDD